MSFRFYLPAALMLALLAATTQAVEFTWPGHGTIAVDAPANWTLRGAAGGEVGFTFRGEVDAKSAAVLQVTLVALPPDKTAPTHGEAKDRLEKMVADALPDSVEKTFSPIALKLRQGHGWYVQLTDASLVGKPPEPENLKIMRNAFASLDANTMAVITMQFDDPNSAAPAEMLRIVESLRLQAAKSDLLRVQHLDDFYELNVPPSRVTLKIPSAGLAPQRANVGGGTASPRYFHFTGSNTGLVASGWFESASRYSNLISFWKGEADGLKRGGQAEPAHVRYGKVGDWETIDYDTAEAGITQSHIRAELTRAGTWIDLHGSLTRDRPAEELHAELKTFLESLVIENK